MCQDILKIFVKEELTAQQIAAKLNIPTLTTYRKIKTLESLDLIKKSKLVRTLKVFPKAFIKVQYMK